MHVVVLNYRMQAESKKENSRPRKLFALSA